MRVLFLTTVLPSEERTGGEIASQSFVRAIEAAGHETYVLGFRRRGRTSPLAPNEVAVGDRVIETQLAPRALVAAWMAYSFVPRRDPLPYCMAKFFAPTYARTAVQWAGGADVAVIDHAQIGWLEQRLPRDLPRVFVAHNVEHRDYQARAARASGGATMIYEREARLIRRVEDRLARVSRQTWAVAAAEHAYFSEDTDGTCRLFALPPRPRQRRGVASVRSDVLLFGTWSWEPNRRGLQWFVDDVLPRLPAELVVRVAGVGAEAFARPNLHIEGFVDDLQALIAGARVVAVPSVSGEGVQIKTLDALAAGAPLVATPVAVRGLDDLPDDVVITADADAFSKALVRASRANPDRTRLRQWAADRRARFDRDVAAALAAIST